MKVGSGDNGELTFLDVIAIVGFCVGLQNLDLNISEQDLADQTKVLDEELRAVVDDIHKHLSVQDAKINLILNMLEERNDKDKETR